MLEQLSLRVRVFLFFCLLGLGSVTIIAGSFWYSAGRESAGNNGTTIASAGIIAAFLILGLVVFVWRLFDENVARAIERLSAQIRAQAHTEVDRPIDATPAKYLGDLAHAVDAVSSNLTEQKSALRAAVAQQTSQLQAESAQLIALLSDIQSGLLLCSSSHKLVFYNTPAVELLRDTGKPGLDRSVFELLRAPPILQTYDRLMASHEDEANAELLVSTSGYGRTIAAHMRLVAQRGTTETDEKPGYVLTLRDVTADLGLHAERERVMRESAEAMQGPSTRLRHLLTNDDGDADTPAIRTETELLLDAVDDFTTQQSAKVAAWWPMQDVRASHLVDGIRGQLGQDGPTLDAPVPNIRLRCDGFAMVGLLTQLTEGVQAEHAVEAVSIAVSNTGPGADLALSWQGAALTQQTLTAMLEQTITDSALGLTGQEVLDLHGMSIDMTTHEDVTTLRLTFSEARDAAPASARSGLNAERPTVFDFDLLNQHSDGSKTGKTLRELTYVVFDTETTGLAPQDGDEICQIAAIRLVKAKRVEGEVIDQLVDPERHIPAKSTEVHGITDDMVQGKPTIRDAGARFHAFCENAVLVAHNAPFDLTFLHRHAAEIGAEFDHPVFDTVLLSAILFGQEQSHTLDALAERFGVVIPEEVRHTAYGDTVATAEVFQRMLPMLEARGLDTYDAVIDEMSRNSKLMRKMNARVKK